MLVIDSVCKSYNQGGSAVLEKASFHLQRGTFAALVGPSGSGKSTLLNLIGLLDHADSGQIIIDGKGVEVLSPAEGARIRNQLIGFVFQSFHLLSRLTAWENVALPLFHRGIGREERKSRALTMLDMVGLRDRVYHRPEQLSGGQRQRVAIARALVGKPSLVLADEPTGSLDRATGAQVMDLLRALNHELGVTILMVTHDHEMAKYCDRVIEIRDGRILPQGKVK